MFVHVWGHCLIQKLNLEKKVLKYNMQIYFFLNKSTQAAQKNVLQVKEMYARVCLLQVAKYNTVCVVAKAMMTWMMMNPRSCNCDLFLF